MQLRDRPEDGTLPATISDIEDLGTYKIVRARLGKAEVAIKLPETQPAPGDQAYVGFPPRWTKLYADGRLVA